MAFIFNTIFKTLLFYFFIMCTSTSSLLAETVIEDTEFGDEITVVKLQPSYSLYHERYSENAITGIIFSAQTKDSSSLLKAGLLFGLKFGVFQSKQSNDHVFIPSIDFGLMGSFGRELFVYSEIGLDLAELAAEISSNILRDDERNEILVDIDRFATVGVGVNVKRFGVSVYAKLSRISGNWVRDETAIYYGIKITHSYPG